MVKVSKQHKRMTGFSIIAQATEKSEMSVKMEIVCIGNELLIGKTLNTNAQWLARHATNLGVVVRRITVVGDDVNEIARAICEALKRKPRFIITTGGLGPTFDDKTMEGITKGLRLRLEVNDNALKMVREKYETLLREGRIEKVELTPARVKMTRFPEGTKPLYNPVGTAPGMLACVDGVFLIALPGVPPEMEAIFEGSITSMLKKEAGKSAFFEASIYVKGVMESSLAPLIDKVMHDDPRVYIKSHVYTKLHPQTEGRRSHIELHFSTTAEDSEAATARLDKAIVQLSELVKKGGGKVSRPA
jgi:molybdenum cofactor synthesis domain-containing protein